MVKNCDVQKIPPFRRFVIQNFPFIEDDFDALTTSQRITYIIRYINAMADFLNNVIEDELTEYIDERFNDMMIDAMYEEETETLVLSLTERNGD